MATTPKPSHAKDSLLRMADVRARTKLGRTTIYRKAAEGTFPKAIAISAGAVAWYESEVDAWVADPMGWRAAA